MSDSHFEALIEQLKLLGKVIEAKDILIKELQRKLDAKDNK